MSDLEVRRDDLRTTRVTAGEERRDTVAPATLQLRVERFGMSANNVTYGVLGDALSYWSFFPASEPGWGRVPVWGFGEVVASAVDGVAVGERFYGYLPMSTYVTLEAEARGPGFVATGEHRRELPAVYNQYLRTRPDAPRPDETLLLRPLFGTSFLLDDFLRGGGLSGADAVVLASASSKTAYGLAFLLARGDDPPAVIGLTSPRNRDFVAGLGPYGRVLAYDELDALAAGDEPLVFVDMAGDAEVRAAVHHAAGDRLRHSAVVGVTHWEQAGDASGLPGPAPAFFFAPTHLRRLESELGPDELGRRQGEAWAAFAAQLDDWMEVEHGEGPEAVQRTWRAFVDGDVDPRRGHVLSLPT